MLGGNLRKVKSKRFRSRVSDMGKVQYFMNLLLMYKILTNEDCHNVREKYGETRKPNSEHSENMKNGMGN